MIHMGSLLKVVEEQGQSVASLLKCAVLPMAKVLIMCSLGFLMTIPHINILPASGRKLLSKLVFSLLLPCLIFTQLGKAATLQNLQQWWFIPVNVVLASVVGCFIGLLLVIIVKPPLEYRKFTIVMVGIGNIGNIPLVLIDAICRDKHNPFGNSEICNAQGVAYISFGQWVGAVIVYTFVYKMLSPSTTPVNYSKLRQQDVEGGSPSTIPLLGDQHNNDDSNIITSSFASKIWSHASIIANQLKLQQIFQPPVCASILALIVGTTPALKNLLLTEDAPLFFFSDSLNILGGAMIPCIMLVLGGNLAGGPGSSKLGLRTTVAITFTRLIIVPLGGLGIVTMADKLGFLPPDDKMFRFVLLLQHSMPTSILAGTIATLRGVAEKETSAVLFWEHILAVFSLAGWLIIYLNYLF